MCKGGTLTELVKAQFNSRVGIDNRILYPIVSGLWHLILHAKKMMRRELKPVNIPISTPKGNDSRLVMKWDDFWMSRNVLAEDGKHLKRKKLMDKCNYPISIPFSSNPGWIAPVVFKGRQKYSKKSVEKIFPLCLIFAFTLSGVHPIEEESEKRNEFIRRDPNKVRKYKENKRERYNFQFILIQ